MTRNRHGYAGPKGASYVQTLATRWGAVCRCGWEGPLRVTRMRAESDWRLHAEREAREMRDAVEWDRGAGLEDGDES